MVELYFDVISAKCRVREILKPFEIMIAGTGKNFLKYVLNFLCDRSHKEMMLRKIARRVSYQKECPI